MQVARKTFPPPSSSLVTLIIVQPGPPPANFVHFPFDPSIHDTVQFFDTAGDPAFIGFTADDGAVGKVTFRAVATIVDARDALPADNQAIAAPTEVKR